MDYSSLDNVVLDRDLPEHGLKRGDLGEIGGGEDVHRFRSNGVDDGFDVGHRAQSGGVEAVGAGGGVGGEAADRFGEIGTAGDEAFRSADEKDAGTALIDRGARGF